MVVAAVSLALLALGQSCLLAADEPRRLGLRVAADGGWLVVTWVQPAGFAWDAGIRSGDRVVGVAGRPVTSPVDPAAVAAAAEVRVRAAAGVVRQASVRGRGMLRSPQSRLSFLALAASFVVIGGAVFILAADLLAATAVLGFGVATAVMLLAAIPADAGVGWALTLEFLALISFGATTLFLFLVFPVDRLGSRPARWGGGACVLASGALVAAYALVVARAPAAYALVRPAAYALWALELLAASALAVLSWLQPAPGQREARGALGLVAAGALVGFAPFCGLVLAPSLLGRSALLPPEAAILSIVLLPMSLAVAVLQRQLLGIERLIRRGMTALAVWGVLLAAYGAGAGALRWAIAARAGALASGPVATVLEVALVAATFPLLQARLRRALERAIFRDVYGYAETVQHLGAEIVHCRGVDAIAAHTLARVGRTLDLAWAAIALADGAAGELHRYGAAPDDAALRALVAGEATAGVWRAPLVAEGAAVGTLLVGPKRRDVALRPEDATLLASLAPLVAVALRNALLLRQLEQQVAALGERERALAALSGRLLRVQEDERRRLALDVHDDPLQRAILLARDLGGATAPDRLPRCRAAAQEIVASLRALCSELRPPVLDDLGLAAGLDWLVNDLRARSDLAVALVVEPAGDAFPRLAADLETALYRVAQEALHNCAKHAEASAVAVRLRLVGPTVELRVADDGRGCPAGHGQDGEAAGLGLLGMRERLRPWDGRVTVRAGAQGGTVVTAAAVVGGDGS